jgi:histidine triad (HIT) family protein
MPSLFTRIVRGEVPCHKVWEDEHHLAFLDINPIQPGHVLVIPKREIGYLFDLSAAEQAALWNAVHVVEEMVRRATGCKRVCLMVVGWEVPHVHVHLVPTNHAADFPVPPKIVQTQDQLAAVARAMQLES